MKNLTVTRKTRAAAKRNIIVLSLVTTVAAGHITYRTRRPLTEQIAQRVARMMQANARFMDATIVKAKKANHYHVCYLPNNTARIAAAVRNEDNKDVAAMQRDGRYFLYTEKTPGMFTCKGITGTYTTSMSTCDCPQQKFRRNHVGGECKHIKELRRRSEAGILSAGRAA